MKHKPCLHNTLNDGPHDIYRFTNGYGASVINSWVSHFKQELAVVKWQDKYAQNDDYKLCYDTPITNDVIQEISDTELEALLNKIKALPKQRTQDAN